MECEFTEISSKEEAELQCSTKKVKETLSAPQVKGSHAGSYRDKLVGEIPGAFLHAFALDKPTFSQDEIGEEEDDVQAVVDGIANVLLSKDTKLCIRSKWAHSLIVKVFGRTVGFHFLHSRIMSLWKLGGRLDCVDLDHDFFLIRFGLFEDFDKVLRGGPWFIGDHYLTIKPWEPNFKPSTANCSSVAVWARLPELPIKYYESRVPKNIGSALGPILRIDTQTTTEFKGRYARVCVQVNLDVPLTRAIRIGHLHQPVVYKGLNLLWFSYGHLVHWKVSCPYTIKDPTSSPVTNCVEPEAEIIKDLAAK